MSKKFVGENALLYVWQKNLNLLSGKVDSVEGKGLSTNDFTDEYKAKILNAVEYSTDEKAKLEGIEEGAEVNKIDTVKVNGTALIVNERGVDVTVPTATSDLTNDSGYLIESDVETLISGKGYQTESDVSTAIATALANVTSLSYSIVVELPEIGEKGVIYLISNGGSSNNVYDEYIYVNDGFEKLGTTEMDLSGYVKVDDLEEISNDEIEALFA